MDDLDLDHDDGTAPATPAISKSKSASAKKNKSASKRKQPQGNKNNNDEEATPPLKKSRGKGRKTAQLERRLKLVESELAHHKAQEGLLRSEDEGASGLRRSTRAKKKANEPKFKGELDSLTA